MRGRLRRAGFGAAVALAAYAGLVVIVNIFYTPGSGPLDVRGAAHLPRAGASLSVLIWNLGYAGLGAESDFVADGGRHYLPPSRAGVRENLAGIASVLARTDADLFLFQEVARAGPLNYWVDVLDGIERALPGRASVFDPEVLTRLLPPPLRLAHGTAIFGRLKIGASERVALPLESERLAGLLRRRYRMHVARLPIAQASGEWVIVNVHLAAFDRDAELRLRQLREVVRFAQREFDKGNPVVIGGDWNMEFVKQRFPHATDDKFLFWLHDFPFAELAEGWRAAFDASVPSARTLHEPYRPGRTYVTVIDGFVVSPNVEVESVRGIDLAFAYSDHQPVRGVFRYRGTR
ncbi:MAG TPA: endonuclease/exonuclease/phosphatase family protein [Hyphomicrobiaceae bacterium]|nr:endonuclease/exonuclease/phosphatase family protein [Hyphomicrobiaceae bacterium]